MEEFSFAAHRQSPPPTHVLDRRKKHGMENLTTAAAACTCQVLLINYNAISVIPAILCIFLHFGATVCNFYVPLQILREIWSLLMNSY